MNVQSARHERIRLQHCLARTAAALLFAISTYTSAWASGESGSSEATPLFGIFERTLDATGKHSNPYAVIDATATLRSPDGRQLTIPLFWDGGQNWKLRVSPDRVGTWTWSVESNDAGLDGQFGELRVADSKRRGGITPMKENSHHLQRQNGEPFWFFGDTAWALYTDSDEEKHDRLTVKKYIATRAKQGFNVIHSMLLSEAGWGNSGGPPFNDIKAQQINPGYWQEVDRRLACLNRQGVTGGLALAWGNKGRGEKYPWNAFSDLEAKKRYVRYIAARYSAFDVYFIVSGEWHAEIRTTPGATEQSVKREFIALGDELMKHDPHDRMIAIHPMTAAGTTRDFNDTKWMSFADYQQNYRDLHGRVLLSRKLVGQVSNLPTGKKAGRKDGRLETCPTKKPVVNSEYAYYLRDRDGDGRCDKPNSAGLDMIRHATWDIVMAGGYVVAGFGSTYFGGNRHPGPFNVDDPRNDEWEEQILHVRKLFTDLEWWRLEPHDELIEAPVDRSPDGRLQRVIAPPKTAYWALSDPGRQHILYVRGCRQPLSLSLGGKGDLSYELRQFNPRTGGFSKPTADRHKTQIEYTPPDSHDWVLVVTAAKDLN